MNPIAAVSMRAGIAVVTLDAPPVNAMTRDLRAAVKEAFESLQGRGDA